MCKFWDGALTLVSFFTVFLGFLVHTFFYPGRKPVHQFPFIRNKWKFYQTWGGKRVKGEEVRWKWMRWYAAVYFCVCGYMYRLSLVLLRPTSTLTFYPVGGKAERALITLTTTAFVMLLSHRMSRNPTYTHNTCSIGLHYIQRQYLARLAKGHLTLLHWPTWNCCTCVNYRTNISLNKCVFIKLFLCFANSRAFTKA